MAARLVFNKTTPFGAITSISISALVKATSDINRIKGVADSLTGGGVTPANLEGSTEFGVAVGSGATFYANLQNIIAGLAAISSLPSMDQGN